MVLGILLFSVMIFFVSFFMSKRHRSYDRSEIAAYVVLIAWGSLLLGLFISGLSPKA